MSFDTLNQREIGYQLMKSLATHALATCQIQHKTYLDLIFVPAMQQLYAQKQPFVPSEFAGPHPTQDTLSFYR